VRAAELIVVEVGVLRAEEVQAVLIDFETGASLNNDTTDKQK
jgi:hypothetical protein